MSDNLAFDVSVELGQELHAAKQSAFKASEKTAPLGKRRIEPAEYRREMEEGGKAVWMGELDRLTKEMGGNRYAARQEFFRMMGLKPPVMPGGMP